jgi:chemotaxis protein MotB
MPKPQKCPDCKEMPAWITTFSDLMSLLLTFFVLLLSFSSTAEDDFKKAMGSLQGALGVLAGEPILTSPIKLNVPILRGDITEARPTMNDAKAEIEKEIEAEQQENNVEVLQGEEGITIRIKDKALFSSAGAEIKEDILPLLNKIGGVLARMPNAVEIMGHTDNRPISNETFPNNFWLSNARALNVLDVFVNEVGIGPERLSAIGYGEFRPLVPNDSPDNQAQNRRVEIKIRHEEGAEEATPESVRQLLEEAQLGVQEKE